MEAFAASSPDTVERRASATALKCVKERFLRGSEAYGACYACNHRMDFILGDNLLYLSNKNLHHGEVTISNRS